MFSAAILIVCLHSSICVATEPDVNGKHLFILSGQSNMVGMKPEVSFTPAVDTTAIIAVARMLREIAGRICFVAASDRHNPVEIPKCAALCWRKINMIVDRVTIQRSLYPKSEPAAIFEAQLPGSMKPTVTKSPGPMYFNTSSPVIFGGTVSFSSCFKYEIERMFFKLHLFACLVSGF